ncbi:MAG TPA: transposase, partial [Myxococcaceae bacterium]|nr:transposase [Myxococcaceae bacterium]
RWRRVGTRRELLTSVLAPTQLTAPEALALYPHRWSIERMFFDLKEVLNLNRLYAANPHAVAMQVYAAGLVYNAMRVAQSEAGAQVGVPPEDLAPAKLFPRLAAAAFRYLLEQEIEQQWHRRHPRWHPQLLRRRRGRWMRAPLAILHVERRKGRRRKRRYCPARRHWKSLAHVRGGRRFTKLS